MGEDSRKIFERASMFSKIRKASEDLDSSISDTSIIDRVSLGDPFVPNVLEGINSRFIRGDALQKLSTLFEHSYDHPTEIHKYSLYSENTGLVMAASLPDLVQDSLSDYLQNNVFWLDILSPSSEEIKAIAEIFQLHQLTLEDMELESNDPEIREKCDVFENYYYINLKAVDTEQSFGLGPLVPINLAILVFPGMVITTHREPLYFHRTVAKRIRLLTSRTKASADWIGYSILEDVVDFFSISGRAIENEVDSIDELVMVLSVNDQEDVLRRIGTIRKRVVQQLRFVSDKTEIFRTIVKRASHRFGEDAGFYLRDLQEHVLMLDQNLDQYDDSLNSSHNNYLARVSIDISHVSNTLNDTMKKLTVATFVAMPWSMISGLWGMNLHVPGHEAESFFPFIVVFLLMISSSIITYIIGIRRGLGGKEMPRADRLAVRNPLKDCTNDLQVKERLDKTLKSAFVEAHDVAVSSSTILQPEQIAIWEDSAIVKQSAIELKSALVDALEENRRLHSKIAVLKVDIEEIDELKKELEMIYTLYSVAKNEIEYLQENKEQ